MYHTQYSLITQYHTTHSPHGPHLPYSSLPHPLRPNSAVSWCDSAKLCVCHVHREGSPSREFFFGVKSCEVPSRGKVPRWNMPDFTYRATGCLAARVRAMAWNIHNTSTTKHTYTYITKMLLTFKWCTCLYWRLTSFLQLLHCTLREKNNDWHNKIR